MIRAVGCSRSDRTAVGSMTCTVDMAEGAALFNSYFRDARLGGGSSGYSSLVRLSMYFKKQIYAPRLWLSGQKWAFWVFL